MSLVSCNKPDEGDARHTSKKASEILKSKK